MLKPMIDEVKGGQASLQAQMKKHLATEEHIEQQLNKQRSELVQISKDLHTMKRLVSNNTLDDLLLKLHA